MKITSFEVFKVPPRWLFLKIETDDNDGVTGWGEPIVVGKADTVRASVAELMESLIGMDPRLIEKHWNMLYRGGPVTAAAPQSRAGARGLPKVTPISVRGSEGITRYIVRTDLLPSSLRSRFSHRNPV